MARRSERTNNFSLGLGELVGKSLSVYLRNFIPFTLLSALVLSPWVALSIAFPPSPNTPGMNMLGNITSALLTYLLTGAVSYGVVQQLRGKPAGMADAISQGMKTFLPVLGTGILAGIRIGLFTLLLVIPGIIESVRLYVAIPAAVMEGKSGTAAIERSIRLTMGSRWQIFGAWFLIFMLPILIVTIAMFGVAATNGDAETPPVWLQVAVNVVLAPFGASAAAVCYFLLRSGKEQVDVKDIAAVFD